MQAARSNSLCSTPLVCRSTVRPKSWLISNGSYTTKRALHSGATSPVILKSRDATISPFSMVSRGTIVTTVLCTQYDSSHIELLLLQIGAKNAGINASWPEHNILLQNQQQPCKHCHYLLQASQRSASTRAGNCCTGNHLLASVAQ